LHWHNRDKWDKKEPQGSFFVKGAKKVAEFLRRLFGRKKSGVLCSAVVVAAGSASRMQGIDKIMAEIGGEPVLCHAIQPFEECAMVREIIVVTRGDMIVQASQLCRDYSFSKVTKVVAGGKSRTESVLAGVGEISSGTQLIAIHDGARPFPTAELIEEAISRGAATGAAAPALPVKDTVKRAKNGLVTETLDRTELFLIQTPQVFEASILKAALLKAHREKVDLPDDCAAVERLGMTVALTQGSEENLKITSPSDLLLCEAILERRGRE
jgi:2-C-methyl-D-erythritol 4-phosphate cytidylyltransferase